MGDEDFQRLSRTGAGYTLGQFHPELNLIDALPKVTFGGSSTPNPPNFTYDNRIVGDGGVAWVHSFNDNLTWIKGSHAFKGGVYFEHLYNTEGKGFSAPASFAGQYDFTVDTNNPLDTGYSFANALLGKYRSYSEIDALPEVNSHRYLLESYLQDTWKVSRRVTLDYGVRILWFKPWYTKLPAATFVAERYDPSKAPRLYQPARVNNTNVALDPITGAVKPNIYVGSFVPGTGDPYNGMVLSTDPNYPRGFRQNQGLQPEPRLGFAWDVTGQAKTAVHGSLGLFHNSQITARSMDQAATNPPAVNSPQFVYGTMSHPSSQAASHCVRARSRPRAGRQDAEHVPVVSRGPAGDRLGDGRGRHLRRLGGTAHGAVHGTSTWSRRAKFVNLHPENANPQNTADAKPDDFLRPYLGYGDIILRSNFRDRELQRLQVQLNRRYSHGFQFSWPTPTLAPGHRRTKTVTQVSVAAAPGWHYARSAEPDPRPRHQLHLGLLRRASGGTTRFSPYALRRLAGLGENAFVSGSGTASTSPPPTTSTSRAARAAPAPTCRRRQRVAELRVVRPNIIGNIRAATAAPRRARTVLDRSTAVAPGPREIRQRLRYSFQNPGIDNWNLAFFKNFGLGGERRRLQLRWEMFNVLNHTQYLTIDNTARFDVAGNQVNASFGEANAARNARIMQGSIRLSF